MQVSELVDFIKNERPKLLGKMPEKRTEALIRVALNRLGKHIAAVEEGVVKVPGFGNFRVHRVEQEKDGVNVTVKRIVFHAAKPKADLGAKPKANLGAKPKAK